MFILPVLNAGEDNDSTYKIIGFNIYHANSASGYGKSLNLNMSIEREKRHLEAGIIMQQESARISGGEIIYRHYISSPNKNQSTQNKQYRNLRVYFQYNFVFRKHILPDSFEIMPSNLQEIVLPGGRVATFEHYAGMGAQVRLFDNFFLNGVLGCGIILGSIDEKFIDQQHYTMDGRKNDFGMVTRFGFSYFLGK